MNPVATVHTVDDLRRRTVRWRAAGDRIALVPTMGALHDGHLSLVRLARRHAERVVVSIFVNPSQFAPNEDFSSYPRSLDADRAMLADVAADLVFNPSVAEMYGESFVTTVSLKGPAAAGLDDVFRPTHFQGVATIVAKLFIQASPDVAMFGEKDYQQLKVVTRMARDLDLPVRIVPVPTVREPDGLAMSSRNRYLSPGDRAKAPLIHSILTETAGRMNAGEPLDRALDDARSKIIAAGFTLDYCEARHAESLAPIAGLAQGPIRLLVAARIGAMRLIDNIAV